MRRTGYSSGRIVLGVAVAAAVAWSVKPVVVWMVRLVQSASDSIGWLDPRLLAAPLTAFVFVLLAGKLAGNVAGDRTVPFAIALVWSVGLMLLSGGSSVLTNLGVLGLVGAVSGYALRAQGRTAGRLSH